MTDQSVARPEFIRKTSGSKSYGVVEKPLSLPERIYDLNWVRKAFILLFLAIAWQIYALHLNNILLFPTLGETFQALVEGVQSGGLLKRAWFSLSLLLQGYAIGLFLATILTGIAIGTQVGRIF